MIRNKYIWIFFSILALIIVSSFFLARFTAPPPLKPRFNTSEAQGGNYYTVIDGKGEVLLQTGFPVNQGDIFIDEKDRVFKVSTLEGWKAMAIPTTLTVSERPAYTPSAIFAAPDGEIRLRQSGIHVVLYHTHSDESYPLTDGTSSIKSGGTIYEVGNSLSSSLRGSGISVSHSDNTHGPHDPNAYYRSRRTVFQLLKQRPDAVFDVHRDSAPGEAYLTLINGLPTSKAMIVVGRQNPHMSTNLAFARRIKEQADKVYPGLLRGIFIGQGNYNQDLYPTALLFEIGTDQAPRENAERGARNLGDVVADVLRSRNRGSPSV